MSEHRVYNFAAGPAAIADEVLKKAQFELLNYNGSGMSVMELSHRSKEFEAIISKAEADLRKLLKIPDNYKVLFVQGGGNTQFSMIPMNLLNSLNAPVDYVVTGTWSASAAKEAAKYTDKLNIIQCKTDQGFVKITPRSEWKTSPDASYLYYCDNETVDGVEFDWIPDVKVPLVCDMSSNILSKAIDVSKFGLIFAGAQKNIGPSGVTVVIIRDDLLGKHLGITPTMLSYKTFADHQSLFNTPPTYGIYMSGLVFEWMLEKGGIPYFEELSAKKSNRIYQIIEESNGFYYCPVGKSFRSRMNVCYRIHDTPNHNGTDLEKKFVEEAEKNMMHQLKGHRSVGGIRASLYNAVTFEAVEYLANFMIEFQMRHAS